MFTLLRLKILKVSFQFDSIVVSIDIPWGRNGDYEYLFFDSSFVFSFQDCGRSNL